MELYRICSQSEIDSLQAAGSFSEIGRLIDETTKNNLNRYECSIGTRYIHFFQAKSATWLMEGGSRSSWEIYFNV